MNQINRKYLLLKSVLLFLASICLCFLCIYFYNINTIYSIEFLLTATILMFFSVFLFGNYIEDVIIRKHWREKPTIENFDYMVLNILLIIFLLWVFKISKNIDTIDGKFTTIVSLIWAIKKILQFPRFLIYWKGDWF